MKTRDHYLSGILLVLIGVFIGTLFAFYQQENSLNDRAEVKLTQIKQSDEPIFTDKELAKMDDRFLFKKVAESVTPSVVYIETLVPFSSREMPDDEYHEREEGFWGNMLPKKARTVGSGILVSSDGYILTNNHVIDGADNEDIEVILNDKRAFDARIVGQDPTTDLAVVKIDGKDFPAVVIGNSDKLKVGEWVLAIGNPFRLRSTVTAGIVSALGRNMEIINDRMRVESFIQTDAAINKGNSGGALVNTSGELVGVNTAIASQSGSYQGYGFAVPSNLAAKVSRDIIEFGEVHRALLGISIVSVNASLAKELDMDEIHGVQITGISPGGAADKFGLERNDVILSVNGKKVNESNHLQQKIAVQHPGEIVTLQIWRDGQVWEKKVKLGGADANREQLAFANRPSYENNDENRPYNEEYPSFRGVEFADFDLGMRVMAISRSSDLDTYDLIIAEVKESSEAEKKGLKKGLTIKKVGGQKVVDIESLKRMIASNLDERESVTFEVETEEGDIKMIKLEK